MKWNKVVNDEAHYHKVRSHLPSEKITITMTYSISFFSLSLSALSAVLGEKSAQFCGIDWNLTQFIKWAESAKRYIQSFS